MRPGEASSSEGSSLNKNGRGAKTWGGDRGRNRGPAATAVQNWGSRWRDNKKLFCRQEGPYHFTYPNESICHVGADVEPFFFTNNTP